MKFTKMHGLGNDFIIVLRQELGNEFNINEFTRKICARNTGIGADGLVIVDQQDDNSDASMRIINADGTDAEQCGNALRCLSKFVYEQLGVKKQNLIIKTDSGYQDVSLGLIDGEVDEITVNMGKPVCGTDRNHKQILQADSNTTFQASLISVGNPHAVIEVDDLDSFEVGYWGPILSQNKTFNNGINIEFINIKSPEHVQMRVWERGAGETMACGSGACAVVVAGVSSGRLNREAVVHLDGGVLSIKWDHTTDNIYMTGPAVFVFEGIYQK